QVTRYAYDKDGRQVFSVDALGNTVENIYDNNGNVVQSRAYANALTSAQLTTIDASTDRLTTIRTSLTADITKDRITHTAYDKANRARYQIDALGYVTEMQYDAVGNITRTTRYANKIPLQDSASFSNTAAYTYDSTNNVLVANAAGHSLILNAAVAGDSTPTGVSLTLYKADGTATGPAQVTTVSQEIGSYLAIGGNLVRQVNAATNWIGQVNVNTTGLTAGTYTAVVTIADKAYTTSAQAGASTPVGYIYYYDNKDGVWTRATTLRITMDASGNVTRVIAIPSEIEVQQLLTADAINDQVTHYAYDKDGRVTSTTDALNGITSTTYDALGNAIVSRDASGNYSYKVYDQAGRVKYAIDAARDLTEYTYDAFGNQKALTRYDSPLAESVFTAKETASNAGNVTGFSISDIQGLITVTVWSQDFTSDTSGLVNEANGSSTLPSPYMILENGQLTVTTQQLASGSADAWPIATSATPRSFSSGLLFYYEVTPGPKITGRV
ncbi:MAG: hypothetical protein AAB263_04215, partial [Planctomycetota bacterium]